MSSADEVVSTERSSFSLGIPFIETISQDGDTLPAREMISGNKFSRAVWPWIGTHVRHVPLGIGSAV